MSANRFLSELDISIFEMFMGGNTKKSIMGLLDIRSCRLEDSIRNINRTIFSGSMPKYWLVDKDIILGNFNAQIEYQKECEKLNEKKMSKFNFLD